MITTNKEPITASVDKKRLHETSMCPKCGKSMNRKTLLYSHDCEKIKQPTIKNHPKPVKLQNRMYTNIC